jgi:hypothetical protein
MLEPRKQTLVCRHVSKWGESETASGERGSGHSFILETQPDCYRLAFQFAVPKPKKISRRCGRTQYASFAAHQ